MFILLRHSLRCWSLRKLYLWLKFCTNSIFLLSAPYPVGYLTLCSNLACLSLRFVLHSRDCCNYSWICVWAGCHRAKAYKVCWACEIEGLCKKEVFQEEWQQRLALLGQLGRESGVTFCLEFPLLSRARKRHCASCVIWLLWLAEQYFITHSTINFKRRFYSL